jgi:hypothetical protein
MKGNLPRIHTANIVGAGIDNAVSAAVTALNVGRSVGDAITIVVGIGGRPTVALAKFCITPILQIAKNVVMYC